VGDAIVRTFAGPGEVKRGEFIYMTQYCPQLLPTIASITAAYPKCAIASATQE
jgi:hypothetical protein